MISNSKTKDKRLWGNSNTHSP